MNNSIMKKSIGNYIVLMKNEKLWHYFRLYSLIFILSFVIAIIAGLKINSLSDSATYFVGNYSSLKNADSSMMSILSNNFLISILFLYVFYAMKKRMFKEFFGIQYFIYIGVISGLLISKMAMKTSMIVALSLIMPHGIIEIPAIIFAAASGWALSDLKDLNNWLIPIEFIYTVIILLILFSISAYIESNITLRIYDMVK